MNGFFDPRFPGGKSVPRMRPNCNLSDLVEMGGQKAHFGPVEDNFCSLCGQKEHAPGFVGPSLWQRIKRWFR